MEFTARLRDRVRRGEITTSIRIWMKPHVKRGGRYRMGEGEIEVDSIEPMELSDITPALARESGFSSVVDLLKVAKHGPGQNVYLVRFHYVAPGKKQRIADGGSGVVRKRSPKARGTQQRQRIARIVERLPEGAATQQGTHLKLEVRKKCFGWFLDDHHGDGRVALNCKASADMHDVLKQLMPGQFHIPKYLGNKGWIGLWLDIKPLNWTSVELALRGAYSLAAPKALARQLSIDNG